MRLTYATQAAAQAKADAIHQWMQANNAEYAQSVTEGRTTAAMVPYQDKNAQGQPIDTQWHINVKERHLGALTAQERAAL